MSEHTGEFPRPQFSPEQAEQAYDMTALVAPYLAKIAEIERNTISVLVAVAEADESKPGIKVSGEYHFEKDRNTYVYEQTIAFDVDVPRGEVHFMPATGFGIGRYDE